MFVTKEPRMITLTDIPPTTLGPLPDREVRDLMTPGVVSIVEDASLSQACRALTRHRVHAVLVLGRRQGRPLGWVTARGLLGWLHRDLSSIPARNAIVEPPVTVEPSATASEAVGLLSREGVSHLLVSHSPDLLPEGVVSDADLARIACREIR
jgi:CBS domain-containing protein